MHVSEPAEEIAVCGMHTLELCHNDALVVVGVSRLCCRDAVVESVEAGLEQIEACSEELNELQPPIAFIDELDDDELKVAKPAAIDVTVYESQRRYGIG